MFTTKPDDDGQSVSDLQSERSKVRRCVNDDLDERASTNRLLAITVTSCDLVIELNPSLPNVQSDLVSLQLLMADATTKVDDDEEQR